jgi:hypothetical protein
MIHFRCWFCNRTFLEPDEFVGRRFRCTCGRRAKVPRRSGRSSKSRSFGEWLIESLVYGGLCATFACGLSFFVISRAAFFRGNFTPLVVATLSGFVGGALFGERALNYFGQKVRNRESR